MKNEKFKYSKLTPKIILILIFLYPLISTISQISKNPVQISGYVSGMPSFIFQQPANEVWRQIPVHNRLNLGWQFAKNWRIDAGMRNRFSTGSETLINPASAGFDNGWTDLSWNWAKGKNYLGNTSFDRVYITFEHEKWKWQLGRQRINWGQTFVWNPNDIFNTYSFFDFDYPERSGCDAFRGTFYHNETASSELAVSVNHDGKITAALLHHWNWKNSDFQVIGGIFEESDVVLGGAMTSDFKGLNFRSEFSFFQSIKSNSTWKLPLPLTVAISAGLDYIFSNSLMLQTEVLYNHNESNRFSDNGLMGLYAAPLSAKYLSICEWNVFAQASYPLTSRLNASLSGMYFVDISAN